MQKSWKRELGEAALQGVAAGGVIGLVVVIIAVVYLR